VRVSRVNGAARQKFSQIKDLETNLEAGSRAGKSFKMKDLVPALKVVCELALASESAGGFLA
jgi:hypothetical protein